MNRETPTYVDWPAFRQALQSPFFSGTQADRIADRHRNIDLAPNIEALFTQSNARVLLGHAANGMLRFVALPTQLYAAPTGTRELGLGVGMYHHFDTVMYAGDLCYRLEVDDLDDPVILSSTEAPAAGIEVETVYADDCIPRTTGAVAGLEVTLTSIAPVTADVESAPLAPAPLPGPAGAVYALHLYNVSEASVKGRVVLQASDLLVGHYEDARISTDEGSRSVQPAHTQLRQHTLILTQPYGAVGVHLHDGTWRRLTPPYEAESAFNLAPGESRTFETQIALGATYTDIMPTIYTLHMQSALDWLNLTAGFWRERLGTLTVDAHEATKEAQVSRDIYVRSLFDNFNCLQTDGEGTLLAHWQGAPSHGYGTVWGIDVEPTAVSIAHLCPEMTWATLRFFMDRSRAPKGTPDHSVPILVAPIIIARQWLQITGDVDKLVQNPDVMAALMSIVDDLMALKAPNEALFPSRYSSDGAVGRRYDYGTNVKVWYAFDSMALLARTLGNAEMAATYKETADAIREAIGHTMIIEGPFGPQISGGTNLGEDPGSFYLPEGIPYYDGEDTSSMLAPIYGMIGLTDEVWVNYHRFARSIWCPNFDFEFGALRWSPRGFAGGALDGTGYFSRLAGSVTDEEMLEALGTLWHVATDDVTGSVFWWPHGLEYKRSLTRCSQGQGAWAWQYLKQWLGLEVDADARTLTVAPRGLLNAVNWQGFRAGPHIFDVSWREHPVSRGSDTNPDESAQTTVEITNHNGDPWTVRFGFRHSGAGATDDLVWQTRILASGVTDAFTHTSTRAATARPMDEPHMVPLEVEAEGEGGILVRRFGPEQLWGHWDIEKLWAAESMPLTIRLLIENGTESDWPKVTAELACPNGWHARGRQPQHWTQPQVWDCEAALTLGTIPACSRAVAPFWVRWPAELALDLDWHEGPEVPFHATTQPGGTLTLYAINAEEPVKVTFMATVRIASSGGDVVARSIEIPVRVLPASARAAETSAGS